MSGPDPSRWRRASELFEQWLDLEPAALATQLERLRAEDAAIAAEVERLFVADRAAGVLDGGVIAIAPTLIDDLRARAPDAEAEAVLAPGSTVGPFRLHSLLGRGGMGDVYRAERIGAGYTQTVALKLLRRGADSIDVLRRFVQERRILAQLEHPGIARLIDGGMSADGLPWIAMELVEGEAITAYAQRHALGLSQRIELLIAVSDALDYAHRRLIVHRDLKPSNVLVGADGAPRLLDFGIAKLLDQPDGDVVTGTGVRVLSPAYAAPEQIAGEPIGIATDVHALGLLLYELLTGELPHERRAKGLAALGRTLETEPERPSACLRRMRGADISIVAHALEGDLDTIALKALAFEPDRRYSSAMALADDLRRHLQGRPIAARPDTVSYRLGKFVRRHRGGVAIGAIAALGIVAALIFALWQTRIAQREAAAALESAARTSRVKAFMMETFIQADPFRNRVAGPQTLEEAVDNALARVDRDLGDDPTLQLDLLDDFGEIRSGQGRLDEAQALFERALALAEKTYGPHHPAVAEALLNLASLDIYKERFLEAAANGERAFAILERRADIEPLALVNALGMMSVVRNAQGREHDAVALTGRALETQRRHGAATDPMLAVAFHNHGVNLSNVGRVVEAEQMLRESLALRERELGVDNPTLGYTLSALSKILYERGQIAESVAIDERRVAIARKAFPDAHAWTADALSDLGWGRIESGRNSEGRALLEEAVAIYEELDSSAVLRPLRFLALGKRRSGDLPGAIAVIDRAWTVCAKQEGLALCSVIRANRAGLLALTGHAAEALAQADLAVTELEAMGDVGDGDMGQALASRALALSGLGRSAEAVAAQQAALAIYADVYGEAHPETKRVRAGLQALRDVPAASP